MKERRRRARARARALWVPVYYASSAGSLAILIGFATVIVARSQDAPVLSDVFEWSLRCSRAGWLAAAAGALLGLGLARWKRGSADVYRLQHAFGVLLLVLAVVAGGFLMFASMATPQGVDAWQWLGIWILVVQAATGVAGCGACLWLAGFSARRIAKSCAPTDPPSALEGPKRASSGSR